MKRFGKIILALVLGWVSWVAPVSASSFRPVPLSTLVQRSTLVVVATPVSMQSHWAQIGSKSRVVTDVTLEVSWTIRGTDSTGQDIVVRTLGGTVDNRAHLVYGEARLRVGQSCLLFLVPGREGALHVYGMAQGHYPLELNSDGEWRVRQSPGLDGVLKPELSAVQALSGQRLLEVPRLLEAHEATP